MPEPKPSSQSEPKGDSQPKQSPALPPTPTANPAEVPVVVDARGGKDVKFQSVAAPVVPAGEIAVVQSPIVLANTREMDPTNPAGAPRQEFGHSDKSRRAAHAELTELLRKGPGHPEYNADRVYDLHYLVNGEQPPARQS